MWMCLQIFCMVKSFRAWHFRILGWCRKKKEKWKDANGSCSEWSGLLFTLISMEWEVSPLTAKIYSMQTKHLCKYNYAYVYVSSSSPFSFFSTCFNTFEDTPTHLYIHWCRTFGTNAFLLCTFVKVILYRLLGNAYRIYRCARHTQEHFLLRTKAYTYKNYHWDRFDKHDFRVLVQIFNKMFDFKFL